MVEYVIPSLVLKTMEQHVIIAFGFLCYNIFLIYGYMDLDMIHLSM
jgi:hypothetical protein